ncbi:flagellar basal body L-ring protein FlgH [Gemmatimonas sp.]|jgi:flagellar L-ring protein precursor FlgH|uniref:flagellar basal body L-ring protein FlgH n=1 Tax=Gemmatimonas sp. TaxID=1962908 RepID=UPI0022C9FA9E|nr:flagellar basal body L-ring protein FlgH [Gemmatimonas sp.]MCZ8203853.1 flagellar basal body L-ring protein FlgH [Gemmatimonas sp.]
MSRQRSPLALAAALAFAPFTVSAQAASQPPGSQAATAPAANAPAANAPAANAPAIPAPPPRNAWVSDRRQFAVGDIITVLIDDYTISTAVKENLNQDLRNRGFGLNARVPGSSQSANIDARNNADQTQRGQARRENRFQNEMSVRVVAVGPNGLLQVKGTKKIDVDRAMQDIVFTGWVRAQDVSVTNLIESSRVADAQLGYASPGPLGKPKQGIISKVLGMVWP